MTLEQIEKQKKIVFSQLISAMESGDEQKFNQLVKKLPVEPATAFAIKEVWGVEALTGYNLDEARLAYGEHEFN